MWPCIPINAKKFFWVGTNRPGIRLVWPCTGYFTVAALIRARNNSELISGMKHRYLSLPSTLPPQRKTTKYPIALFNPASHDGGYHNGIFPWRVCFTKKQSKSGRAGSPLPAASTINSVFHPPTHQRTVAALVRARKNKVQPHKPGSALANPERAVDRVSCLDSAPPRLRGEGFAEKFSECCGGANVSERRHRFGISLDTDCGCSLGERRRLGYSRAASCS